MRSSTFRRSLRLPLKAGAVFVLDSRVRVAQTGQAGVNHLVGYLADAGAVLPFAAEIAYYPLYLWPR